MTKMSNLWIVLAVLVGPLVGSEYASGSPWWVLALTFVVPVLALTALTVRRGRA